MVVAGDGCATCQLEGCGSRIVDEAVRDDGNQVGDECTNGCSLALQR